MVKVRLSTTAREDLRNIRIYSKTAHGPAIARDYILGLRNALDLLGDRPLIGVRQDDLGAGIRGFSYRSHRIFYQTNAQSVVVIRILHQAQDQRGALNQTQ